MQGVNLISVLKANWEEGWTGQSGVLRGERWSAWGGRGTLLMFWGKEGRREGFDYAYSVDKRSLIVESI